MRPEPGAELGLMLGLSDTEHSRPERCLNCCATRQPAPEFYHLTARLADKLNKTNACLSCIYKKAIFFHFLKMIC